MLFWLYYHTESRILNINIAIALTRTCNNYSDLVKTSNYHAETTNHVILFRRVTQL